MRKSRRVVVQRTGTGKASAVSQKSNKNVGVSGTHRGRPGMVVFPRGGWSGAGCVGLGGMVSI